MSGGADWSTPTSATGYLTVLTNLSDKDIDAITLQKTAPSNLPTGAIAWDRANLKFKEWSGAAFVDMIVALVGGGTGSATAAGARTNLGLGTIAVQDANAVTITGGSITGITLAASVITSGQVALARGGTGASLALGASGSILQSNGAAVVFGTDGSQLTALNASNLASGTVALARLPAQGYTEVTKSALYTVTPTDINNKTCILCNGTFTLTLPAANNGSINTPPFGLRIINISTGVITLTPASGTILGAASYVFDFGQYSSGEIFPDTGNNDWKIF
jgi:hypothetical protein